MSLARALFLGSWVAIALCALSTLAWGEPGGWWVAGLLFAIGGVAFIGVYFPWLEMFGPIVCRGPAQGSQLALTFDDGPHPVTTRRVLAALANTRHRATFFVLGEKVERCPEVVREIRDAGHTLAVHGFHHDRLHFSRSARRIAQELTRALDAIERACGVRPTWFRPPVGQTSPMSLSGVKKAGLRIVGWSGRSYDGVRSATAESVLRHLKPQLSAGAILVLHDAAERDNFEPASLSALPQLLAELDARGLTSTGLEQLLSRPTS